MLLRTRPDPFFRHHKENGKKRSGNARLDQEPVGTGRRPEKNVVVLFQDDVLFYKTTSYHFKTTSYFTRRRAIAVKISSFLILFF